MRIILCVTNDIATDQRVNRIALSLKKIPADVLLVGISFPTACHCRSMPAKHTGSTCFLKRGLCFMLSII